MWIKEGFNRLYSGKDALSRHLTLFSVCGIFAILSVYISTDGVETLNIFQAVLYGVLCILFSMYIVGYEVLFLNERELPDVDFRPFKLIIKTPLIYFFLFNFLLVAAKFFPDYIKAAFVTEMLLAVPLTMIQAGYSYNFSEEEAYKLYENSSFKNYAMLFFKRLALFLGAFLFVSFLIFILFFAVGAIVSLFLHGKSEEAVLFFTSNQFIIDKLSNILGNILLIYLLTIVTLVWDYELIKTYENS